MANVSAIQEFKNEFLKLPFGWLISLDHNLLYDRFILSKTRVKPGSH